MSSVFLGSIRLLVPTTRLPTSALARSRYSSWNRNGVIWRRDVSEGLSCGARLRLKARPKLCIACGLARLGVRGFSESKDKDALSPPPKTPLRKRILPVTLHENIYTVPNILTFSRLLAAPAIGYLIVHSQPQLALGLFVYAGVTDLLDGWIARRWHLQTVVGTVIDPMADKALMTIATIALAYEGTLPVYLAVVILGRDVGLAISAIYYRYISLPPPKTFARYWDFSLPSAEVRPTEISKWNTFFQLALIGWTMGMPMLRGMGGLELEAALVGMQYFVAATTVWSGASYIYSKDAVKILSQEEAKEKEMERKGKKDVDGSDGKA